MPLIYLHGVSVRSETHGIELEKSFRRWLGRNRSPLKPDFQYMPIYWGDLAAQFGWNLASRPKTALLAMGEEPTNQDMHLLGLSGKMRVADLSRVKPRFEDDAESPVLGAAPAVSPSASATINLAEIPFESRPDFIVDIGLALTEHEPGEDVLVSDNRLAGIAAAADTVAENWDQVVSQGATEAEKINALLAALDKELPEPILKAQGGRDALLSVGEFFQRVVALPGDAASLVAGEMRPALNRFVAYFIGDVLIYINGRGITTEPGPIPSRVIASLKKAKEMKEKTGDPLVVVTHSMGGQIFYDVMQHFAKFDSDIEDINVDHWISCGSQVSFFAELDTLLDQPGRGPDKISMPKRVSRWTNYYDVNDLVGFVMEPVFMGVKDVPYNTGYGLAFSHSGFLARPSFYKQIAEALSEVP